MTEKEVLSSDINRRVLSMVLSCLFGWTCTYLTIYIFRNYATGLFVWLPFVLGALSTFLYSYKKPTNRLALRDNAYFTLLLFCIGLLFFAWEGLICLVMAAPIGFLFTYFGFLISYSLLKSKWNNKTPIVTIFFTITLPALMAFEHTTENADELREVTTAIEINATPETVWNNVISFPRLENPTELIFKIGIAYPTNATINGKGVGSIRHCQFSTGSFIEPITIWEPGKLLKFSVDEQPEPLKEISLYDIHPNHLHGYWVSRKGQFKLIKLSNGHTKLVGTTWYLNRIKPGIYWTLWSDFIVHTIHQRVLRHIKVQAELAK